ncbi:protein kinase domain-containing protein [Pseudomonas viridiflava]|uniref:protein kinase domain-containing protein n=1 Tax=Pseudomonas viridiflava TaxID=33069 RepID=UPI00197F0FD7|nr:protein kinase [Pseudomonas viridiflava]
MARLLTLKSDSDSQSHRRLIGVTLKSRHKTEQASKESEILEDLSFYDLNDDMQALILAGALGNRGNVVNRLSGMCGDIFVLDQGEHALPRYVCAKVPRRAGNISIEDMNKRFIVELELQLQFYHHAFVHWCFDLKEVLGAPVALFRYWDGDLRNTMSSQSEVEKLALLAYCCSGLMHCYGRGLLAHQDLKPANIFIRDYRKVFHGLRQLDIYLVALVADFGLANAFITSGVFEGSRPYMAPEQWSRSALTERTDVFALGIILHELLTGGYHPVGVRTEEVWPTPLPGQSRKWLRADSWQKWINRGCPLGAPVVLGADVKELIEHALSSDPGSRPSMTDLRAAILDLIQARSDDAHHQLQFLWDYFDDGASQAPLATEWPYLAKAWERLQKRFG